MPERIEIYIVYKRRYINALPFLSFSVTNLRSEEIQDSGGRHPNNLKLRYLGNGLTDLHSIWLDDAYWPSEPGMLFTKVRTPVSVRKFCVRKVVRA